MKKKQVILKTIKDEKYRIKIFINNTFSYLNVRARSRENAFSEYGTFFHLIVEHGKK
jgi:hypothetical protein